MTRASIGKGRLELTMHHRKREHNTSASSNTKSATVSAAFVVADIEQLDDDALHAIPEAAYAGIAEVIDGNQGVEGDDDLEACENPC